MIKCKDQNGNVLNNILRNQTSNAIVMTPDDKYSSYLREKKQTEKILDLEAKLNEVMRLISKLD